MQLCCVNAQLFWTDVRAFVYLSLDLSLLSQRFLGSGIDVGKKEFRELIVVLGTHALWCTRTDVVNCVLHPKPAWWHFVIKVSYTISVLNNDTDSDIQEVLHRKCATTSRWSRQHKQLPPFMQKP